MPIRHLFAYDLCFASHVVWKSRSYVFFFVVYRGARIGLHAAMRLALTARWTGFDFSTKGSALGSSKHGFGEFLTIGTVWSIHGRADFRIQRFATSNPKYVFGRVGPLFSSGLSLSAIRTLSLFADDL